LFGSATRAFCFDSARLVFEDRANLSFARQAVLPARGATIGLDALFGFLVRLRIEAADAVHVERVEVGAGAVDVDAVIAQVVGAWAGDPPAVVAAAVVVPHRV
jgi:hypothetical protein